MFRTQKSIEINNSEFAKYAWKKLGQSILLQMHFTNKILHRSEISLRKLKYKKIQICQSTKRQRIKFDFTSYFSSIFIIFFIVRRMVTRCWPEFDLRSRETAFLFPFLLVFLWIIIYTRSMCVSNVFYNHTVQFNFALVCLCARKIVTQYLTLISFFV